LPYWGAVEITSFCLSVGRAAQRGYLTAGKSGVTAALRDNALVVGDSIASQPVTQDQSTIRVYWRL
jgi:hypothetical protein